MSRGVTLVTGSNGGVGSNVVDYLLAEGFRDVVCQYHESRDVIEKIVARHGLDPSKHLLSADLTNEADVRLLRESVLGRFRRIWGLVNFAGLSTNAVSWKMTLRDFRRVIDVNLVTAFLTSREFIPSMREAEGGRIVNVSSVVAHTGAVGAAHYAAAKAGVIGLTRALALELVSKNITANVIALGYFGYGMIHSIPEAQLDVIRQRIPMNRLGKANEIGGMLRFLLSEDSSFVTGQTLHINGGQYA